MEKSTPNQPIKRVRNTKHFIPVNKFVQDVMPSTPLKPNGARNAFSQACNQPKPKNPASANGEGPVATDWSLSELPHAGKATHAQEATARMSLAQGGLVAVIGEVFDDMMVLS